MPRVWYITSKTKGLFSWFHLTSVIGASDSNSPTNTTILTKLKSTKALSNLIREELNKLRCKAWLVSKTTWIRQRIQFVEEIQSSCSWPSLRKLKKPTILPNSSSTIRVAQSKALMTHQWAMRVQLQYRKVELIFKSHLEDANFRLTLYLIIFKIWLCF